MMGNVLILRVLDDIEAAYYPDESIEFARFTATIINLREWRSHEEGYQQPAPFWRSEYCRH
jgi:hypothetical protein